MNLSLDSILTNEYAFTFLITFFGITLKGLYSRHEHFKAALLNEVYDLAPELVFISISFTVSFYTQVIAQSPNHPILFVDRVLLFLLLILVILIVFLKRIGTGAEKRDLWKGLIIPLFLGFSALFVVLTFTHLNYE
jgi:hypothetical protein